MLAQNITYPNCLNPSYRNSWLGMWQMGSAPFVGGGLGHFMPMHQGNGISINRYAMETKRQLDVLDQRICLANQPL